MTATGYAVRPPTAADRDRWRELSAEYAAFYGVEQTEQGADKSQAPVGAVAHEGAADHGVERRVPVALGAHRLYDQGRVPAKPENPRAGDVVTGPGRGPQGRDGVHPRGVRRPGRQVPLGAVMNKGLTLRGAQLHGHRYIPEMLGLLARGEVVTEHLATHTMGLPEGPRGYQMFKDKTDGCVRAVFTPGS